MFLIMHVYDDSSFFVYLHELRVRNYTFIHFLLHKMTAENVLIVSFP